jgi:hypothetical protein
MDTPSIQGPAGPVPDTAGHPPVASPPATSAPGIRRSALVLGTAIVAVAVIATLVIAALSRPPAVFSPDTPEGAFQAYLAAWEADDLGAAHALLSDRIRAKLSEDRYRALARDYSQYGDGSGPDRRVVLLGTTSNGDRATLDLRVDEQGGGGLFGGQSVWSRTITVDLVREHDTWHLDQALAGLDPMWFEE